MSNQMRDASCQVQRPHARKFYEKRFDFPRFDKQPFLEYMLAALPRSGSTFLCREMWRTGLMGAPMEYLNPLFASVIAHRLVIDDIDIEILTYWSAVKRLRTSPNGVFGYKMFISFYLEFGRKHSELLSHLMPDKVIFLTRSSLVDQAVSYSRAIRSESWFHDVPERVHPGYDADHIRQCVDSLHYQLDFWRELFDLTGTAAHHVTYEKLLDDPRGVLEGIANFLGVKIDPKAAIALPCTLIQRNAESADWVRRFKNEVTPVTDVECACFSSSSKIEIPVFAKAPPTPELTVSTAISSDILTRVTE